MNEGDLGPDPEFYVFVQDLPIETFSSPQAAAKVAVVHLRVRTMKVGLGANADGLLGIKRIQQLAAEVEKELSK